MNILVAEDNKESRYLLEKLLQGHGHEVTAVSNGAEALEQALAQPPDIIVSDIMMPEMDGFQLCHKCKQKEQLKNIPFIFYTATYTLDEDKKFALSLGADAFILKPAEPDILVRKLSEEFKKAKSRPLAPDKIVSLEPVLYLTEYNKRIVAKLEQKMVQLETEITRRKQAEEKMGHLNLVLRAIRSVNQLIVTEKDRERLIQDVCDNLIETRGYYNAWVVLMDEAGKYVMSAESGLGKDFLSMADRLKRGELTICGKKALSQPDVVVTIDPLSECVGCPLSGEYDGRSAMTVRLEHRGRNYGLLSVSIPRDFVDDKEEHGLLREVVGDIAFALHGIDMEKERDRAEIAMRESEEKYRRLAETATDIIFTLDTEGKFTYLNPEVEKITGYHFKEWIGRSFTEILAPEYIKSTVNRFRQGLSGETIPLYEIELIHRNGRKVPVELSVTSLFDAGGEITGRIGIARDITERKMAEEEKKKIEAQLQHAQKMEAIGTLAGGIAHDFNNLLMGIQGNASLAFCEMDTTHPHYGRLKNIEQYVQQGAELTRQLLGFARGGKYETKLTDLNELVEKGSDMFGRTKKEITIRSKYQKDIWAAEVDQGQIEQVLLNLYVNAWQAMPGGGNLYLQTENVTLDENYVKPYDVSPGRYVKISVTDTGVGMDEATLQRIFEPFFTTKEMGRGTGLGLASAYGIIINHKGIINVYSEKGVGTTFNIYLPASESVVRGGRGQKRTASDGT